MPRPRTPTAKARVAGRDVVNPARFKRRKDPASEPLGPPPTWMSREQRIVWLSFKSELPWLNGSHRALVEIATVQRARLVAGEDVGVQALQLLRQCLGQMGATPADATKVNVPDAGEEDPDEAFFGRPN